MMAAFVTEGNIDSAIKAGIEVLGAGRGVLRAFLRNSVLDQAEMPNRPAKTARFTLEIRQRVDHRDGPYDGDIIARLEKMREVLEKAVVAETGVVFTERVTAYNAMNDALRSADEKQKQLDRTRLETMRQKVKTADVLKSRPGQKTKPTMQRTATIAQREEEAQEILAFL